MTRAKLATPPVVEPAEWSKALTSLRIKEKKSTGHLDALAAERRRLPMVKIQKDYFFEGADGTSSLADLFDVRRQLIVYHFMFASEWEWPPTHRCWQ